MKIVKTFIKAIVAGMFIGIGGSAFLMIENKVVGSVMFAVGLFAICTMGFNLFTGKVCYVFENKIFLTSFASFFTESRYASSTGLKF